MSLRATKVTLDGDKATALTVLRLTATLVDGEGHKQPFVLRQTSRDTWARTGQGWKMRFRDRLASE